MSFITDFRKLGFFDSVCETTAEHSVEADINLPDYCPEIQKILKCSVSPYVVSVTNSNGRVTADVNAVMRIIYVGDNGKLAGYEHSSRIQKYIDSPKVTADCAVNVKVNTDYVNCRAVNPRRLDVKGMLTFTFKANNNRTEDILCGAQGNGVQLKCEDMNAASLIGLTERAFNIGEVIEIGGDKNPIANIISVNPYTEVSELKIINNKALIKGMCFVKIYYIGEENSSVESVEHSMPVSQIIELDGIDEKSLSNLSLNITSCEAVSKADSSGNMRLIDLNVRISAFLCAFEETQVNLISDAYSTEYETENRVKSIEMIEYNDSFNTSFVNKVVLESIGVTVDCVLAVWCSDIKYSFNAKEDKCSVSGTYTATVIYKDAEGNIGTVQKPVDFDSSVKVKNKAERLFVLGSAQICACSCALTGDSRLELKTEIIANGTVFSNSVRKYVSDIVMKSESKKKKDTCALTVCYCEKGENVWNIARRYNTTVEAVMNENNLSEESLSGARMLLIPSA